MKYAIVLLFSTLTVFAAERSWEASVDVNDDVRFSVDNHKGLINIEVGASDKVTMSARVYMPSDADYTEEEAQKVIDAVQFDLSESARAVSLDVELDQDFDFGKLFKRRNQTHPLVDLTIRVPPNASLDVETHKGTLEVSAPSGPVNIETHKGKGYVRGVRDDLKIETHKGDLDVEVDQLGDIKVETHKGNVEMVVRGASNFTIKAESHKGDFSFSGYDIEVYEEDNDGPEVNHKQGDGSNRIKLETHKGNIHIDFK